MPPRKRATAADALPEGHGKKKAKVPQRAAQEEVEEDDFDDDVDEEQQEEEMETQDAAENDDDEDDEEDGGETAFKDGRRGKRTAAEDPNVDEEAEEDEDNFDEEEEEEEEEDDDDSDDSDDEKEKVASEAGIIHDIHVWNFMNHRELHLQFNRSINFIHGQNGSGKSAVLAALQICLGARANITHRGTLKSLVRRNAEGTHTGTAKVQVTLLNGGPDAFRPQVYGKRITVERQFNGAGTKNEYRLLNAKGNTVSKKKDDLTNMLDMLNIQVENPVCIMDQENSKEFIKGNEKNKYDFFSKATDLRRANDLLDASTSEVEMQRKAIKESRKRLQCYANDLDQAQKDLKELKKILEVDDKINMYRSALFWVDVADTEEKLEEIQGKMDVLAKKETEAKAKTEKAKAAVDQEKSSEDMKEEIRRLQENSQEAAAHVDRLTKEVSLASKPAKAAERDVQQAQKKVRECKQEMKITQEKIDDAEEERKKHGGDEERRRQEAVEAARQAAASLQQQIDASRERADALKQDQEAKDQEANALKQDYEALVQELNDAKSLRHGLQQTQKSPTQQFGPKVQQIRKLIQQNKARFEHEPVGPIGLYVKLKPGMEKWKAAITHNLGGARAMSSFLANSAKDYQLLKGILQQCGASGDHSITTLRFRPRVGSPGQPTLRSPADHLLTVERAIQVDNDVVFNYLCEGSGIENCILADTPEAVEQAMITGTKGNLSMVQNVGRGFDLTGSFTSVRDRNKYYIRFNGKPMSFGTDVKQELASAERDVQQVEQRQAGAKNRVQMAMKEAHGARSDHKAACQAELDIRRQHKKAETTVRKCVEALQELESETAVDTSDWEAEIQECQAQLEGHEAAIKEAMKKKKEADNAVKEKQAEKKKYEKSVHDLQTEMVKAEEEISSLMREADVRKKKHEKAKAKEEMIQVALEELAGGREDQEKVVAASTERATKFTMQNLNAAMLEKLPDGCRINVGNNKPDYYKEKIKALTARKEKGLKDLPVGQRDLPGAVFKAAKAKEVYDDKMQGLTLLKENNDMLQSDLAKRRRKWKRFRSKIAKRADKNFDKTLQLKGQSGDLIFDHQAKELSLSVMKDNRDTQSQISNVKLLSGGERSYTTLALLMSLGDSLECPFRIMDEFDVFMDSVSRNVALQTLVEEGLRRKDRQFVLITPQNVDSIVPGPHVKVIKLEPAKKTGGAENAHGQQSLNFGEAGGSAIDVNDD